MDLHLTIFSIILGIATSLISLLIVITYDKINNVTETTKCSKQSSIDFLEIFKRLIVAPITETLLIFSIFYFCSYVLNVNLLSFILVVLSAAWLHRDRRIVELIVIVATFIIMAIQYDIIKVSYGSYLAIFFVFLTHLSHNLNLIFIPIIHRKFFL